jgi:radical SAM superfamily enzyme YgiQ (UPF0313 family)
MKVLLVYPSTPETFWSFRHVLRLVSKKAAFPPLGLLTVAAMLPDDWALRLVDMNVETLRDEVIQEYDWVFVSAMLIHKEAVGELALRCQALGKPVMAGGPLFTANPDLFPEIPHRVLGEAEEVMPQVVEDLRLGTVQAVYQAAGRPALGRVPIPRWDLINVHNYATMAVQFSRGCPYDCEFCDIVVMNGRVPRTKAPGQLIAELEALRAHGWRDMVFIVDDNFIGDRPRTRVLLRALIEWRERTGSPLGFLTEASVNLADDRELCELMVKAGFRKVFVGIETPSVESLNECHKLLNRGRDLVQAVQTLQRSGLEVMGGFIVGFDNDPQDIFRRQFEFIQRSGVVTAMVGLLTALPQTRLYQRLMREGRLETESTGNNTQASLNFRPKLGREFLQAGYRDLMRRLYEPRTYYRRIRTFLKHHRPTTGPRLRLSQTDLQAFLKSLWLLGFRCRGRLAYWRMLVSTLLLRPRQFRQALELMIVGYHFRCIAESL